VRVGARKYPPREVQGVWGGGGPHIPDTPHEGPPPEEEKRKGGGA